MEYQHGLRRNIRFSREEEDQEEDSTTPKNPFLSHHPSSSSSPSSAPPPPFIEKEHMFDKVVTPSDVGKLNRLVLPKQYAEKFFPLDSTANEKGLLLNFEDRNGKPWRFRYSYWNSSQSYVMTKGWSRFVKEKRLDAGDVVSFGRGVGETGRDRLFIDWKRRPEVGLDPPRQLPRVPLAAGAGHGYPLVSFNRGRLFVPPGAVYHDHHHMQGGVGGGGGGYFYFPGAAVAPHGGVREYKGSVVLESVPVGHGQAAAKRVRLFGVNLECPEGDVAVPERVAPHLQLRLGGADSSLQEEGDSRLDLDL